ncbi:zinc finger protein 484-like isoform X2 [Sitophilus oryzae]|uniref:Zinc finger protein 484-like isoform X2 n=1 Tax=Sitophilus oryzae TaxID=7048 RepID=A0A6J2XVV8_SITOR|nr:zinc finger protein 484-like isoform X2 [Sitophilus oryzae]
MLLAEEMKELQRMVYRCSICSYQTPYKSNLKKHKEIHLAPEERQLKKLQKKVHKCSICSFQTVRKFDLKKHQKVHLLPEERQLFFTHHLENNDTNSSAKKTQKPIYRCSTCSYNTTRKYRFNKHKNSHLALEERQLFACVYCNKKYTEKCNLRNHLLIIHSDSRANKVQKNVYSCSTCGYRTLLESHLNRHKIIHLAPEKRESFACAHCHSTYRSKRGLEEHIYSNHIDSRANEVQKTVYTCSTCSYKTTSNYRLNKHKKTHLAPEERQFFACAHCPRKFKIKESLRKHLYNYHIGSRNADCVSPTDEAKLDLDSLKIEIDYHDPLMEDEFKYAEFLSATKEEKSGDLFKIEPDNDAPILHKDSHDDFKYAGFLSATKGEKSGDFFKIEPDDVASILHKDSQDHFKNTENLAATKNLSIKLEDSIKMEPDDPE